MPVLMLGKARVRMPLVAASEGHAPAAVRHRSIAGTQFHPEKSHRFGMNLLASFAEWKPDDADV